MIINTMKVVLLAVALAAIAAAQTVQLTMDEVPLQPINNLAVTKGGITFTFSDPGGQDDYNASNGGQLTFTQDPVIEGPTGDAFSVTLSVPVLFVRLGMAASRQGVGFPIATIQYFNGATLVSTQTLMATAPTPPDNFSNGQVTYNGTYVNKIVVTPATNQNFTAIGFDNLLVSASVSTAVPTLSSGALALMAALMALAGGLALRKQLA